MCLEALANHICPSQKLEDLTLRPYNIPYLEVMKATLTSKGQITIPKEVREKLGLKPGQVLDFDENAPFLKAVPVFDEDAMRSVIGCARGRLGMSSREWLEETRGPFVRIPGDEE